MTGRFLSACLCVCVFVSVGMGVCAVSPSSCPATHTLRFGLQAMAARSRGGNSMAMTACFAGPLFNMLVRDSDTTNAGLVGVLPVHASPRCAWARCAPAAPPSPLPLGLSWETDRGEHQRWPGACPVRPASTPPPPQVGLGLGFWALLSESHMRRAAVVMDPVVLVGCIFIFINCTGLVALALLHRQRLPAWAGWAMVGLYATYLSVVLTVLALT